MKTIDKKNFPKLLLIGIAPLMLIWLIILLIRISVTPFSIINKDETIPFRIYTDQELNGHSVASIEKEDGKGIVFTYTLKEGYVFPYTGICFEAPDGVFDFKEKSIFEIHIKTDVPKVVPLILNEQVSSASGKKMTRLAVYELNVEPSKDHYTISIEDFTVPAWWYKSNQVTETDFAAFNPGNIKNICVQNCLLTTLNTEDHIEVQQLSNRADMSFWFIAATLLSVCWIAGYGIYLLIKKKKTAVFIPYVITESEHDPRDVWEEIRNYISLNYMNDIDMEGMEKALGIAKHKISQVIKENTSLIFKQYLNQIKVAEAKRLLLETNLPIGEIADQVGFGHLSNFNRVFKQYTGESPSDLRASVTNR